MMMPGRGNTGSSGLGSASYRFGFNGKENDNEVKGEGNQINYTERIYDPRVGRFYSLDPLQTKFPFYSPYQFAGNTPIQAIDLDGAEEYHYKMTMDNQGKAILTAAAPTKYSTKHSWFWGLWTTETKITGKRYIVDYDGNTYHIGFTQYGTGYANAWLADDFENNYVKKQGSAIDFEYTYANDNQSQAASDVSIVVNTQNAIAEHSISMAGGEEPPIQTTNKTATAANGGNPEAAEANAAKARSKFLGGAKGELYSKQKILEGIHAPTMQSYEIAGFRISYNKGSAFQMLYEEHQKFISSGNSKLAQAFRAQEASLLKQGKFMDAFELNAKQIQKAYGNKYNDAIQQARTYYQTNIVPQLQKQLAAKSTSH